MQRAFNSAEEECSAGLGRVSTHPGVALKTGAAHLYIVKIEVRKWLGVFEEHFEEQEAGQAVPD